MHSTEVSGVAFVVVETKSASEVVTGAAVVVEDSAGRVVFGVDEEAAACVVVGATTADRSPPQPETINTQISTPANFCIPAVQHISGLKAATCG